MNDNLAAIAGKHELVVGMFQERYGVAKEVTRQQIDGFRKMIRELKKANNAMMERNGVTRKRKNTVKPKSPRKKRPKQ
jgi:hypothetical protein